VNWAVLSGLQPEPIDHSGTAAAWNSKKIVLIKIIYREIGEPKSNSPVLPGSPWRNRRGSAIINCIYGDKLTLPFD
jgi:hypothetical protein